jgi:hypothetical protein
MPDLTCPNCNSTRIRRSRTRTLKEKYLKLFGWKTYRCREKDCRWRGLIKKKGTIESFAKYVDRYANKFMYILVIGFFCFISVKIFGCIAKSPTKPTSLSEIFKLFLEQF